MQEEGAVFPPDPPSSYTLQSFETFGHHIALGVTEAWQFWHIALGAGQLGHTAFVLLMERQFCHAELVQMNVEVGQVAVQMKKDCALLEPVEVGQLALVEVVLVEVGQAAVPLLEVEIEVEQS